MPRVKNQKQIIHACRLHFNGETFGDIAILLDINPTTLSRWRKTDLWQEYEAKLIEEWHQHLQQQGRDTEKER